MTTTDTPGDLALTVREVVHRYPQAASRRRRQTPAPTQGSAREYALDHVSLDVRKGRIFGLLGPNGGGKSTLFRILATMLRPTSGQVHVLGHDVLTQGHQVRRRMGVLFQMPGLDVQLSAYENLRHQGHLYGLYGRELHQRIDLWLERLSLADNRDDRVLTFSGGMRRRLELAKALLHHPRLLLLDEPATGLDPAARHEVWRHLQRLRDEDGVTIALTTHLMDEADRCDDLAILSDGRLVAHDTPARLKARIGGDVVTLIPAPTPAPGSAHGTSHEASAGTVADEGTPRADPALEALAARVNTVLAKADFDPDQVAVSIIEDKIFLQCPDGPAMVAILGAALGGELRSLAVGQPTLEDVFMHLTGKTMTRANPPH